MVKQFLPALVLVAFLSSCTTFKPVFNSSKPLAAVPEKTSQTRFIEDINITPQGGGEKTQVRQELQVTANSGRRGYYNTEASIEKQETRTVENLIANRTYKNVEPVTSLQLKYADLLSTGLESLPSKVLLENVDEWYGVRYVRGGVSKRGVDCSGFSFAVYMAVYGIALPRISREQYRISRKIPTTDLEEGDLVFFNTNGSGVSHVGVYLGNSKFIHASVSKGVMVNSLFESYYTKRFIGGGRIDDKQMVSNTRP